MIGLHDILRAGMVLLALVLLGAPLPAQADVHEKDFDFVCATVAKESAAIVRHGIDWKEVEKRYRPRLAELKSDAELVALVAELLAECRDSHTGLLDYRIGEAKLPSKWDGIWSSGLWIVEDDGRFHLAGRDGKGTIDLGACLVAIGDWPAHLAMERELRRCARILGISSRQSFFASIGNRFVPLRDAEAAELAFLDDGKLKTERFRRWGPSGRGFDSFTVTAPEGLKWAEGAVATMLPGAVGPKIGYLRITGSMDGRTVTAFHAALDGLRGAEAIVLDCRGMGGGSDASAWEMAGRFFPKGVDNGRNGRIEASGSWQFEGPVIMIQDSLEVSSAETFTWAMSETGRAISLGRPTGGWSIIPRRFSAPSGKFDFRVGVTDRATPIKGLKTEGLGWQPDLLVGLGPKLSADASSQLELACDLAVAALAVGVEGARDLFALLGAGRSEDFVREIGRRKGLSGLERWARLFEDDLLATLAVEKLLLEEQQPPDCLGCERRLVGLRERARSRKAKAELKALEKCLKGLVREAKAEEALLEALDRDFGWSAAVRTAYLKKHGKTAYGRFAEERLPARD
ncbi:MAG: hypothetical protein H6807_01355 [Planctomycetes bacterium]|nr:hypothetical protein [Planctomycetota bacterium]